MHAAGVQPLEIATSSHEAAPSDPNVQRRHEVEVAGIALAVLVRLTRHAGDCPHSSHLPKSMNRIGQSITQIGATALVRPQLHVWDEQLLNVIMLSHS